MSCNRDHFNKGPVLFNSLQGLNPIKRRFVDTQKNDLDARGFGQPLKRIPCAMGTRYGTVASSQTSDKVGNELTVIINQENFDQGCHIQSPPEWLRCIKPVTLGCVNISIFNKDCKKLAEIDTAVYFVYTSLHTLRHLQQLSEAGSVENDTFIAFWVHTPNNQFVPKFNGI
jgi:hypothetical protein